MDIDMVLRIVLWNTCETVIISKMYSHVIVTCRCFLLQRTIGWIASHGGYVLAKTESRLGVVLWVCCGSPYTIVVAEPGSDRASFWGLVLLLGIPVS